MIHNILYVMSEWSISRISDRMIHAVWFYLDEMFDSVGDQKLELFFVIGLLFDNESISLGWRRGWSGDNSMILVFASFAP